jgi:hypothetical protein
VQATGRATLVLHLRPSRKKAREAACAELVALLRGLDAREAKGGPLSEVSGVAWVDLPATNFAPALGRLERLGYSGRVELVVAGDEIDDDVPVRSVRWKRQDMGLVAVYDEADSAFREEAPDARDFLLECSDGLVRRIRGYRGGRGPLEHRALPVADARLLVNLVFDVDKGLLLDPFSGAGGILLQARASGWTTVSADVDPTLRFGLAEIGVHHLVGDGRSLALRSGSVDAIATEPPYHPVALAAVNDAVHEMARVLRPGGRAALLVSASQASGILESASEAGLTTELAASIDRKGTDVVCLCLRRVRM